MDTQISKAWKIAAYIACALVMLLLPLSPARGDTLSDWNAIAARMVSSSGQSRAAHELAAVYAAMFEAMNFVEGKYVPRFLVKQPAPLSGSGEAEAIGAAHHVLAQLYPGQKTHLDAALERSLSAFSDSDAAYRACIWGRHLGGNVYAAALSEPDRASNRRGMGSSRESGVSGETWNSIVTRSIEGRTLQPIERARIYALLSLAASAVYSAAGDAGDGAAVPCVSCALGAAMRVILETEFGSGNLAEGGPASERAHARAYLIPVRNEGDESLSAKAGEEMGTRIGLQALTYYRRIK